MPENNLNPETIQQVDAALQTMIMSVQMLSSVLLGGSSSSKVFSKTMTDNAGAVGKSSSAVDQFARQLETGRAALQARVEEERKSAESIARWTAMGAGLPATMKSFTSSLLTTGDNLTKLNGTIDSVANTLSTFAKSYGTTGAIIGTFIDVVGFGAKRINEYADGLLKASDELTNIGTAGKFTSEEIRKMGEDAGYSTITIGSWTKAIKSLGPGMLTLGSSVAAGVIEFGKLTTLTDEQYNHYQRLGQSREMMTQNQADFISLLNKQGMMVTEQMKRDGSLKRASLEYTDNLLQLSSITGLQVDQAKKVNEQAASFYQAQLKNAELEREKIKIAERLVRHEISAPEAAAQTEKINNVIKFAETAIKELTSIDPAKGAMLARSYGMGGALSSEMVMQIKDAGMLMQKIFSGERVEYGLAERLALEKFSSMLDEKWTTSQSALPEFAKLTGVDNPEAISRMIARSKGNLDERQATWRPGTIPPVGSEEAKKQPVATDPAQEYRNWYTNLQKNTQITFDHATKIIVDAAGSYEKAILGTTAVMGGLAIAAMAAASALGLFAGVKSLLGRFAGPAASAALPAAARAAAPVAFDAFAGVGGAAAAGIPVATAAGGAAATGATAAGGAAATGAAVPVAVALAATAIALAGAAAIDAGAGALGYGKDKKGKSLDIDEKQDDSNWKKMTTGQKVVSGGLRGLENTADFLFMGNLVKQARFDRIQAETEGLKSAEEKDKADEEESKTTVKLDGSFVEMTKVTVAFTKALREATDALGNLSISGTGGIKPTVGTGSLRDRIGNRESGAAGYDAVFGHGEAGGDASITAAHGGKTLSQLPIGEVLKISQERGKENKGAVGKYQFMPKTLTGLLTAAGLSPTDPFNAENQEKLYDAFVKQNADYLRSNGVEPTDANLSLAHAVGAKGAIMLLTADKNKNVLDTLGIMSKAGRDTNPHLNTTVGDYLGKIKEGTAGHGTLSGNRGAKPAEIKISADDKKANDWAHSVFVGAATPDQVPAAYKNKVIEILKTVPAEWGKPPAIPIDQPVPNKGIVPGKIFDFTNKTAIQIDEKNANDWAYSVFSGKAEIKDIPKAYLDKVIGILAAGVPKEWGTAPGKIPVATVVQQEEKKPPVPQAAEAEPESNIQITPSSEYEEPAKARPVKAGGPAVDVSKATAPVKFTIPKPGDAENESAAETARLARFKKRTSGFYGEDAVEKRATANKEREDKETAALEASAQAESAKDAADRAEDERKYGETRREFQKQLSPSTNVDPNTLLPKPQKLARGGIVSNSSAGSMVTLGDGPAGHKEAAIPLDPSSIVHRLIQPGSADTLNKSTDSLPMPASVASPLSDMSSGLTVEMMEMLSQKLDTMIDKLSSSNDTQDKILMYSRA